jgi:hypothetical protein
VINEIVRKSIYRPFRSKWLHGAGVGVAVGVAVWVAVGVGVNVAVGVGVRVAVAVGVGVSVGSGVGVAGGAKTLHPARNIATINK